MDRRAFLASVGGLGTVGFAGCLDDATGAGPSTGGDPTTPTETSTPTDTPAMTDRDTSTDDTPTDGTPDDTPTPTATPSGTPPHDAPFPHGRDDVSRVVWFREVSNPEETLHLAHSASSVSLPGEVSFTLHNNADRRFMSNFYGWALYRWEAGRWRHVAPLAVNQPLMSLAPGESHTWTVALSNENLERPQFRSGGTTDVSVEPVGGGSYAFAVDGWWENQDETPTYEHQTVCAARFELDGPQLPLVPSSAVTNTRRDGETVVVEADEPGDDGTPATYVLTRDDSVADARELVTEQVYRQWPLRDALAHADDAAEVRVETTTGVTPLFGVQTEEELAVSYDGSTYRITAEEREV
mgnify:FL=1